ncbi:hypothetical protein ACEQPO_15565 [Bacillus sp. SL00103]
MDEDGYVKITGRLKDMIIRGGGKCFAQKRLKTFFTRIQPFLMHRSLLVFLTRLTEKKPPAFIRLKQGHTVTIETLTSYCQSQMARYKIPKYFFITDEYPMTASGKIQKFRLKKQALDLIKE